MLNKINFYLRNELKELMIHNQYLIAIKLLKRVKLTNDESYEVKYFINYNLALCYMQLNKYTLAYRFCTKAEELFTKDEYIMVNMLYENYDYRKLMKLKDELKERIEDGKINCYIG